MPLHPTPVPIVATVSSQRVRDTLSFGIPRELRDTMTLHIVDMVETISRVMSQIIIQPVLAEVYLDLMSYEPEGVHGVEFYCAPISEAQAGKTFEALSHGYKEATPIGYLRQNRATLNPDIEDETELGSGDTMILVAPSSKHTSWSDTEGPLKLERRALPAAPPSRDVLLIGLGTKAQLIAHQLMKFLPEGSHLRTWESSVKGRKGQCRVTHLKTIDGFRPGESQFMRLIHEGLRDTDEGVDVVVLIPSEHDPLVHDAEILMGLTALEVMWRERKTRPRVVVDLFDPRNAPMVALYNQPVTLNSTTLIANYLVQLSQEPERGLVFQSLIDDPEGCELYARPASLYFAGDPALSFQALSLRARAAGEIAIGLQTKAGLTLCPQDRAAPYAADEVSHLIVIAED